jgi:uncharacterized protein (DUF305 family)
LARRLPLLLFTILLTASGPADAQSTPPVVRPGAPGQPDRVATSAGVTFSAADVAFMQGMIGHHAQAIEMVALLKTRTEREDMKLFALRIEVSQTDEIKLMKRWLELRKQPIPNEHAHHAPGAKLMPGMLTSDDMAKLAAAKGAAFDKLFLEYMIRHHEGALVMVKDLFGSPGAAQEAEVYAFASDVEADQAMEIERMRGMLVGK